MLERASPSKRAIYNHFLNEDCVVGVLTVLSFLDWSDWGGKIYLHIWLNLPKTVKMVVKRQHRVAIEGIGGILFGYYIFSFCHRCKMSPNTIWKTKKPFWDFFQLDLGNLCVWEVHGGLEGFCLDVIFSVLMIGAR